MMALLNWRFVAALVLAVGLAASHYKAYHMGQAEISAAWAADRLAQANQSEELKAEADKRSTELQNKYNTTRKAKDATIAKLDADLADALGRLSDRPSRPGAGSVPADTSAGANTGCTGAGLFAEDASAALREAARANGVLADLAQCQDLYGAARAALGPAP